MALSPRTTARDPEDRTPSAPYWAQQSSRARSSLLIPGPYLPSYRVAKRAPLPQGSAFAEILNLVTTPATPAVLLAPHTHPPTQALRGLALHLSGGKPPALSGFGDEHVSLTLPMLV